MIKGAKLKKLGGKIHYLKEKPTRKEWVKKLDSLLTQLVRARDKVCVRCSKPDICAAHIYSKGRYPRMRYEPDNILGLCYRCHMIWAHREPLEFAEWFKKTYPDRYIYLRRRSQIREGGSIDYRAIELYLLSQLKKYE